MLILYDDAGGHCLKVINGLVPLLAARGFSVETHRIQDGPIDISAFKGLILGSPVSGLGFKGAAPSDALLSMFKSWMISSGIKSLCFVSIPCDWELLWIA